MSVTAIDVVLLPPEDIMVQCREVNRRLLPSVSTGFKFDETHFPHISLLHSYVPTDSLAKGGVIFNHIAEVLRFDLQWKALPLKITELVNGPPFAPNVYLPSYAIEHTPKLDLLHANIVKNLRPVYYLPEPSDFKAYFYVSEEEHSLPCPITHTTSDWVKNFENVSFSKYFPHITLGAGTLDAVNAVIADKNLNKPMEFVATRVAVCQLGNFGTCRKILFEMPPLQL